MGVVLIYADGWAEGQDKAIVPCTVFGWLNFQTVGWRRVITQRERRDWSSPPLCLCKYSCPCHSKFQANKHPRLATSPHSVGPTASSPNSSPAKNHKLRYNRRPSRQAHAPKNST